LRRLAAAATVSYLAVDIRVFSIKGRLGHRNRCGNSGAAGCVPQVLTRASVSFRAEKLRLGRADPRDDIATKGGAECDRRRYRPNGRFQPGRQSRRRPAALPHDRRSGPCLDRATSRLRRFRQLCPARRRTEVADQIGENFYGPRDVRFALQKKACGHAIERATRI
jgi:hypothetical protein